MVRAASGAAVRTLAGRILDARPSLNGIVSIDSQFAIAGRASFGKLDWADAARGHVVGYYAVVDPPATVVLDTLGDSAAAVIGSEGVVSIRLSNLETSSMSFESMAIEPLAGSVRIALAPGGRRLALTYRTAMTGRFGGRGWLVADLATREVLDRTWRRGELVRGLAAIDFDGAGERIAVAEPESDGTVGTFRVARSGTYDTTPPGGAVACAISPRGVIAAFAYPTRPQLRVDYLVTESKRSTIAITDTAWIDPAIGDIVALGFDEASRRIACLAANGAVEVVPVP